MFLSIVRGVEPLAAASALYIDSAFDTNAAITFQIFPGQLLCVMVHVKIETIKNGPYIVTGEVELIDADGNKFAAEKRMALCRCGASTEKPFCDGTHSKIGFKAAEKAVPESKE